MPVARRSRSLVRLFRLFALTAAPLAVELFAPVMSSAHAAEATPSSTSPRKDAKSASSSSKKDSKTTPAHRHRATAMVNERDHERDHDRDSRHSTDVKVDVHIDGKKSAPAEAKPKKASIVDVEIEAPKHEPEHDHLHARRVTKDVHVGRGDHAVEPDRSPKVEATLDPTIRFVPMSATTLTPIDVSVDVKTSGDKSDKSDKAEKPSKKIDNADKPDTRADDGIAPQLLRKIEDKPIDRKAAPGKSTKDRKTKAEKTCLSSAIDVFRGVEEEKVALTKCNGELAPGAVELMSILVRPGSASRPIASLPELIKAHTAGGGAGEIAPGVKRIDGALVTHLEQVVQHFAKKDQAPRVFVISGYRPGSKGSFHQSGKALDFRLDGVKNEDLVAFCKTLTDVGCGYYPNSSFVHMDVRAPGTGHVAWIDASGPGESPNYVASWPPPAVDKDASKMGAAVDKAAEAVARNDVDSDASDVDAKEPKVMPGRGKHVGPFDLPPLPDEEHAADPEAVSDMSQPAADIPASNEE